MQTLFIDTNKEELHIAIIIGEKIIERKVVGNRSHSEIMVPTLQELLESTSVTLESLDQIIVVNGPGSFTGVRIGVTVAKTIAYSLNIPIKTITSLETIGICATDDYDIVTVKDSKGVYSALKNNGLFTNFEYRKNQEFDEYIKEYGYRVCKNNEIDLRRVIEYAKNIECTNPHQVNPIYIKKIDALK